MTHIETVLRGKGQGVLEQTDGINRQQAGNRQWKARSKLCKLCDATQHDDTLNL